MSQIYNYFFDLKIDPFYPYPYCKENYFGGNPLGAPIIFSKYIQFYGSNEIKLWKIYFLIQI